MQKIKRVKSINCKPRKQILQQKTITNRKNIQKTISRLKKFSQDKKLAGLNWKMLKNEGRKGDNKSACKTYVNAV